MKLTMVFGYVLLLGSMMLSLQAQNIESLPAYSTGYHREANPHADLAAAMARASVSKKQILVVVGGDWCRWCGTFDNLLDDNEKVAEAFYGTFEVVRVYYHGNKTSKAAQSLLKQFPAIKGTPHFYILDSKAKLLESVDTRSLERGYGYNKKKVLAFIEKHKSNNKINNQTNKKDTK